MLAAWEIFACLCNGGTLVIRGSKWEPAIELVSLRRSRILHGSELSNSSEKWTDFEENIPQSRSIL